MIGHLGTNLDGTQKTPARWERWRPTVGLFQHGPRDRAPGAAVRFGVRRLGRTCGEGRALRVAGHRSRTGVPADEEPWDFAEVYGDLYDFVRRYPFDPEKRTTWRT
ncbi:MAG: RNA repair transcriptional activator RtcR family protein [Planctomycetota bacterium]